MSDFEKVCSDAQALRQALHRCPEVSFAEHQTSRTLRSWLSERGLSVTPEVGRTGFVVEVRADTPGPARLFRADIDAIGVDGGHEVNLGPVVHPPQQTEPLGRADDEPARHACGHDGHAAMLAGALAVLAAHPDRWTGSVLGVFQPAEEIGKGAAEMLAHDAFSGRSFDYAYALHNQPGLAQGKVAIAKWVAALASTGLIIRMTGKTTHASTPHKGNAAISAIATFVRELLALPSHVVPFGVSVLITPTYLDAGKRQFGRVPPLGELGAVIRSDSDEYLDAVLTEADKRVRAMARSYDLEASMEKIEPYPATYNDLEAVEHARGALESAGFEVDLDDQAQPWSEDFGYFLQRWPGALMLLGAGEEHASLHSEEYEFPDELVEVGVRLWTSLAGWRQAD